MPDHTLVYGKKTLEKLSSAARLNQWIYETVNEHLGSDILEIGSGIGNISRRLPVRNRLTLTDLESGYVDLLRKAFKSNQSIDIYQLDIGREQSYREIPHLYDTVICLNVLEHVENDFTAVRNMSHLLTQGGKLVLLVPAHEWLFGTFDSELGHFRRYSRKSLNALLDKNGMSAVNAFNFNSLGIIGWWINACLLKRKSMNSTQIKIFDMLVPVLKVVERLLPHPGLSIISISQKR